jgi:hypothetical protein
MAVDVITHHSLRDDAAAEECSAGVRMARTHYWEQRRGRRVGRVGRTTPCRPKGSGGALVTCPSGTLPRGHLCYAALRVWASRR